MSATPSPGGATAPDKNCPRCPRLVAFRERQRGLFPDWHNAPVPSFGPTDAPLLIVGLAPGLRGANRTGRPFTGDWAGDLLYPTLTRHGFGKGIFGASPDDGFSLVGCRITNAVRCVPPENKPTPAEITGCRDFLIGELTGMPNIRGVLALGRIAHDATLVAVGARRSAFPFGHARMHDLPNGLWLADSYHSSRYNTNTRRLTPEMFDAVVAAVAARIAG